jgi:plasmid stabilization system protein ParE
VKLLLTPLAYDDLDEIWTYIAGDSEAAADRVVEELHGAMRRLAEYPGIGLYREELEDDSLRVWPVRSYLIVYREGRDQLEVLRVISGYRDLWEALR